MTYNSRGKQSSPAMLILRIRIRASCQVLFDGLDVPFFYSFVNRDIWCFKFGWRRLWLCCFSNLLIKFHFSNWFNGLHFSNWFCFWCRSRLLRLPTPHQK